MKKDQLKAALKSASPGISGLMRLLLIRPLRAYFRFVPFPIGKKVVWDVLAAHLWWLESSVKARTVFGGTYWVDAEDIVGRYIYYFGIWEPNLTDWISRRLKPGDTFVDVGSNIGYYSILASKLVEDSGRVVAIEALPEIFGTLEKNLKMNHSTNVRTVNVAAWHQEGEIEMFTQAENPSGTTTSVSAWAAQWHLQPHGKVPARPLSSILTPGEIKAARLIKIDVEGAEWNVVSGLTSALRACRDDLEIIMEVAPRLLEMEGKTGQDLLGLFRGFGFHPYRIENDYGAAAYFDRRTPSRPARIEQIPTTADQTDIIFSRIDADTL